MIFYGPAIHPVPQTEQEFIARFFSDTPKGYFVDIGAFNGVTFSNTRLLWERGWSGMLIEPDPDTFKQLQKAYAPDITGTDRVTLLNCAISVEDGTARFAQSTEAGKTGIHSMNQSFVATWPAGTARWIDVPMKKLASLSLPSVIDLLSVDAEGMDGTIISSMPETMRPRLVVCEVDKEGVRCQVDRELERRGYEFRWGTYLNSIYARL